MSKYKVCVYAICKNEAKFVERWYNSMKEADAIYVLDTGSTDNTVSLLKKKNIIVKEVNIKPWRFDIARNKSLDLVPEDYDICVCTDLDEVLEEGWRKSLEESWQSTTTRCTDKIHKRHGYKWTHPVHEVLSYDGTENIITIDNITLNHYPDTKKSRSSYLPLLELSVKEDPSDDRNMHYLGREYMYYQKWNECIDTLIKHLSLPSAIWKDERAASMRYIARAYKNLNRIEESRMWLDKAIKEAPYLRDAYVERAILEYELKNYPEVETYLLKALQITTHEKTYINEVFSWDNTIYDLLSISLYNTGKYQESLYYINKAIEMNPNDNRLQENKKIIEGNI